MGPEAHAGRCSTVTCLPPALDLDARAISRVRFQGVLEGGVEGLGFNQEASRRCV